jgi:hypothetical protein
MNFTHESVSAFRDYDVFSTINPVVKAPTLVTDDGIGLSLSACEKTVQIIYERELQPGRKAPPPWIDRG